MTVAKKILIAAFVMTTGFASHSQANNFMTMDDLKELERSRAIAKRLAMKDPQFREQLLAQQQGVHNPQDEFVPFTGKGHKVGGRKGVNRLLGIDEHEAKRIEKARKKYLKKMKKEEQKKAALLARLEAEQASHNKENQSPNPMNQKWQEPTINDSHMRLLALLM